MYLLYYDMYITLLSLSFEVFFLCILVLYIIYVCFFYFNKLYTYTRPLLTVYVCSLALFLFLIFNVDCLAINILGGAFNVTKLDYIMHNFVLALTSILAFVSIFHINKYYSLVNLVEYTILIYILLIAAGFFIYSSDFMSLFLCIELQSMIIYILICLRSTLVHVTIGLRYFMLGTFVSLVFLFSFSMIYAFSGLAGFIDYINITIFINSVSYRYSLLGVYILFLFKLYIYPFNFFGGDLYKACPLYVLYLVSSSLYFVYLYVFLKLMLYMGEAVYIYSLCLMVTLVLSSLNLLIQRNLRSFLGFGTSIHSAFILYLFYVDIYMNIQICLFYACIYIISVLGILGLFSCFNFYNVESGMTSMLNSTSFHSVSFFRNGKIKLFYLEHISDWSGLFKHYKLEAFIMSVFIWSMAGLPPFSGFFTKFCILSICYISNNIGILILLLLISVISSLYYVRVIKEWFYPIANRQLYYNITDIHAIVLYLMFIFAAVSIWWPDIYINLFY